MSGCLFLPGEIVSGIDVMVPSTPNFVRDIFDQVSTAPGPKRKVITASFQILHILQVLAGPFRHPKDINIFRLDMVLKALDSC